MDKLPRGKNGGTVGQECLGAKLALCFTWNDDLVPDETMPAYGSYAVI
jgi:hypothetical protein